VILSQVSLSGRTILISGGSRGIGLAIAKRCAADGARIALLAKTERPHPKLPGTIHDAADEIRADGGQALAIPCDIRDEQAVAVAVGEAAERFGGIDVVVNNASAIQLTGTGETEVRRFDLMMSVNARGSFVVTRSALPHMRRSDAPRILTIAPPLDFASVWWRRHPPYTLSKYAMSLLTMAWAAEFRGTIAANCLWPRTVIDTAAVRNLLGGEAMARRSRRPEIMADAAHCILTRPSSLTGWFCLDDLVLARAGVTDFERYAVTPGADLAADFFVPPETPKPEESTGAIGWRAPALSLSASPSPEEFQMPQLNA